MSNTCFALLSCDKFFGTAYDIIRPKRCNARPLRRRSPYSRHRSLHHRSRSSYSYGYKRSPTPSSSSSPQLADRSRSKSPSDHREKSHHHGKRSTSSRHSSRRRAENPRGEAGSSAQHGERGGSFDAEQQRYLQWKREYREWCEKYFSSYVSHFHQPPPAPFHLNPAAPPPWHEKAGRPHINQDHRRHGRRSAQQGDLSPQSRSSSDSYSTTSQSASDSRSSPSSVPSPRSQSSNDGLKSLPVALTEGSDDSELAEGTGEKKQHVANTYKSTGASKHRRRRQNMDQEGRAGCSYPEPAGSVDEDRKDQRSYGSGEDNSPRRLAAKSDIDHKLKRRGKRDSAKERFADGGGRSDSRHDGHGQNKRRPSKERARSGKEKYRGPRGKSTADWRSERADKRKRQEKASSPQPKTDKSDELQTWKTQPHNQQDKKEKKERQARPVTDGHIWEGGMKVKAQKKISINISKDTRWKEVKTDDNEPNYLGEALGKTGGEYESLQDGGGEVMEKQEDGKQDKKEPVGIWDVISSGNHKEQTEEETSGGTAVEDSWLCALGVAEEEPQAEKQCRETRSEGKWRSIDAEVLAAMGEEEQTRNNLDGGPLVSGGDVRSEFSPI